MMNSIIQFKRFPFLAAAPADEESPPEAEDPAPDDQAEDGGEAEAGDGGDGGE